MDMSAIPFRPVNSLPRDIAPSFGMFWRVPMISKPDCAGDFAGYSGASHSGCRVDLVRGNAGISFAVIA